MKSNFDNLSGIFLLKKLENFKNLSILSQKNPNVVPLDTSIEVLTTMLKSFRQSQLSFRSKSEKDEPKKIFNLNYFPWKRWSGQTESCFKIPAQIFRKNSKSFRSTSEEGGKVYNCFERTIFLQNSAFDT